MWPSNLTPSSLAPRCDYSHSDGSCPTFNCKCYNCHTTGHFTALCRRLCTNRCPVNTPNKCRESRGRPYSLAAKEGQAGHPVEEDKCTEVLPTAHDTQVLVTASHRTPLEKIPMKRKTQSHSIQASGQPHYVFQF